MGSCPSCGAKSKWISPFYVCQGCGLALRRHEYERMHDRQKETFYEVQRNQELGDEGLKKKRNKDYLDWFLGSKK